MGGPRSLPLDLPERCRTLEPAPRVILECLAISSPGQLCILCVVDARVSQTNQEAMEAARMRMQQRHDAQAQLYAERHAEVGGAG